MVGNTPRRMVTHDRAGQMTVEFAVVVPVLLAIGFVALQGLLFVSECVRFDTALRSAVLLQADDPNLGEASCAQVKAWLVEHEGYGEQDLEVELEVIGVGHVQFTGTLRYVPGMLQGVEVFGQDVPELTHSASFAVSPYRKGVVI